MAVGACGVPATLLTFEHVHHAEEGEREGGLPTASATADPDLEREEQVSCEGAGSLGAPGASDASYGGAWGWGVQRIFLSWLSQQLLLSQGWARVWTCFLQWVPRGLPWGPASKCRCRCPFAWAWAWAWLCLVLGCRRVGGTSVSLCARVWQEAWVAECGVQAVSVRPTLNWSHLCPHRFLALGYQQKRQ